MSINWNSPPKAPVPRSTSVKYSDYLSLQGRKSPTLAQAEHEAGVAADVLREALTSANRTGSARTTHEMYYSDATGCPGKPVSIEFSAAGKKLRFEAFIERSVVPFSVLFHVIEPYSKTQGSSYAKERRMGELGLRGEFHGRMDKVIYDTVQAFKALLHPGREVVDFIQNEGV